MKFKTIINSIFPTGLSCLCCNRDIFDDEYNICDMCKNTLPYLTGKLCEHCGEPLVSDGKYCIHCKGSEFYCQKIVSPFIYTNVIKSFVVGLKYNGKKYYANCLGTYMAQTFKQHNIKCDLIIPVPLCEKRAKERGYNQAELLAHVVSKKVNLEMNNKILLRIKQTPTQVNLSHYERNQNMIDAFKVNNKKEIKGKTILLIDDVYTTGATIQECAKTLIIAGAKKVYALTAAHTILKND